MLETHQKDIVVFVIENRKISCEKEPLLQYEYFKALLKESFRESKENEIHIKDVSFELFEQMIKFIRNETLEITFNNLAGLLNLADRFLVVSLKEKCIAFIRPEEQKPTQPQQKNHFHRQHLQNQLKQHTIRDISIQKQTELIEALSRIDPDTVESIFQLIQTTNGYKQILSHQQIILYLKEAIEYGHAYAFTVLLKKYDDPSAQQASGFGHGYPQINYLSLPIDSNSRCLLDIAIEKNELKMLSFLLGKNVFVGYQFYFGNQGKQFTPLSFAAFMNNLEAVKLFLQCFKDNTNQQPPQNHHQAYLYNYNHANTLTALHYAVQHHNLEIAKVILQDKKQDLNTGDIAPFRLAFESGNEDMIRLLINYGADPAWEYEKSQQANQGRGAHFNISLQKKEREDNFFHYAARNKLSKTVVYLFDKPEGLSVHDRNGQCPLHIALELNHEDTITAFFKKNPRVCDSEKRNILHYVCLSKTESRFLSLLDDAGIYHKQFTLFIKDNEGRLPIHYAMESCSLELTQYLIDRGAFDDFICGDSFFDKDKKTPLDLACDKGKKEFVFSTIKYIVTTRTTFSTEIASQLLFWAATREYYDIVQYLVKEKNANVNQYSSSGDSFLHWAARKGRAEAVNFLIQNKAEVNHLNTQNRTALHEAAEKGHYKVVKILLQSGCKASFWDNSGKTPLQLAEIESKKFHSQEAKPYEKTIELLERSECTMQ